MRTSALQRLPKLIALGAAAAIGLVVLMGGLALVAWPWGKAPSAPEPVSAREDEPDDEGRRLLYARDRAAVARDLGRRKSAGAVTFLMAYLKDPDPEVRAAVAWALGEIGTMRPVMDLSLRLDADPDPRARIAIIQALETLGVQAKPPAFTAIAQRLARDEDESVRLAAANVLARMAEEAATEALAGAAGDAAAPVRLAAVTELARRSGPAAWRGLARGLVDAEPSVRAAAAEGVRRAGDQVLPFLAGAMKSSRTLEPRILAARILTATADPGVAPTVLGLLGDLRRQPAKQVAELHAAIVEGLASMGEAAVAPLVREAIDGEHSPAAEQAAAAVCVRIGRPAAAPIAEALLKWRVFPDPEELRLWVRTLGEIGDPAAAPALNRALAQGIAGMEEEVAAARQKIEAASGAALPPPAPDAGLLHGEPGPLAARRVGAAPVILTPTGAMSGEIPDDGVVRLRLPGAANGLEESGQRVVCDLDLELFRREGRWVGPVLGYAPALNKRDHDGRLVAPGEGDRLELRVEMVFHSDRYRRSAYGEYAITLEPGKDAIRGTFRGHCNYQEASGAVTGFGWRRPWAAAAAPPLESGEHPRLIFRRQDLPVLREKARTDFGLRVLAALRARLASHKTLYREPLNWVTTWEPGIDLAIAHGFLGVLFDDPPHGRRAAPLIIDRTHTMPYPGEHGERMPGPQFHYPFAFDLGYDLLLPEEREDILPKRGNINDLFSTWRGPMGVIAAGRGLIGVPGVTALAFLREKGPFNLRPPDAAQPVVVISAAGEIRRGEPADPAAGAADGVPVNRLEPGRMMRNWLAAGPFPDGGGEHPLASLGGPEAARPTVGTEVRHGAGTWRFEPLPEEARREMPPPVRSEYFVIPEAEADSRTFLYALLEVQREFATANLARGGQGCLLERTAEAGARWAAVWINGRRLDDGTVLVLEPGRHRILLEARGPTVTPCFQPVDVGFARGEVKRHERLLEEYLEAKQRHVQTGELQEIPIVLDMCRRGIRTGLWETMVGRPNAARAGWGGLTGPFIAACSTVTGEGLFPDTPLALVEHPDRVADLENQDLCFLLGTAPEALKPVVVWEFNRRFLPDNLGRLSSLQLVGAFVNYPLDVTPRGPGAGR